MESTEKNIDYIDKLLDNQRKSKLWTVISVIIFVIMAVIVLMYSKQLAKTKVKLSKSEAELQLAYDSLKLKKAEVDSLNDLLALRNDSVENANTTLAYSLDKSIATADSVSNQKDTITRLLNTTLQQYVYDNALAKEKINELYEQAFPGTTKKPSVNITEQIIKTKQIEYVEPVQDHLIVRFTEPYKYIAEDLVSRLQGREYAIDEQVQVKGGNFSPVVKYFNEKDKARAERIVAKLNNLYKEKLERPFVTQLVELKTQSRHFEIWIGKYTRREFINIKATELRRVIK
jgi:hypothetical protein